MALGDVSAGLGGNFAGQMQGQMQGYDLLPVTMDGMQVSGRACGGGRAGNENCAPRPARGARPSARPAPLDCCVTLLMTCRACR